MSLAVNIQFNHKFTAFLGGGTRKLPFTDEIKEPLQNVFS